MLTVIFANVLHSSNRCRVLSLQAGHSIFVAVSSDCDRTVAVPPFGLQIDGQLCVQRANYRHEHCNVIVANAGYCVAERGCLPK